MVVLIVALIISFTMTIYIIWKDQKQAERSLEIYNSAKMLKKTAKAKGGFHHSPYSSKQDFLDFMGQFFKHKKHEWIFVAFMKSDFIDRYWLNKGSDSAGVSPLMGIDDTISICKQHGYDCVLVGHNHPSGALEPSKQDRIFLEEFINALGGFNISVEHFVFMAGSWSKYGLSLGQHFRRIFS